MDDKEKNLMDEFKEAVKEELKQYAKENKEEIEEQLETKDDDNESKVDEEEKTDIEKEIDKVVEEEKNLSNQKEETSKEVQTIKREIMPHNEMDDVVIESVETNMTFSEDSNMLDVVSDNDEDSGESSFGI